MRIGERAYERDEYLAVVIDLYSRKVIGWAVSERMKKDLALRSFHHGAFQIARVFQG